LGILPREVKPMRRSSSFAAVLLLAPLVAQDPPKVVSLEPAHLAEVDAKKTKRLVVVFDRAMSETGFSFCGGGPKFPKFAGKPQWQDKKTVVVDVELEPDHEYAMSLNCPAATNFRSKEGAQLAPVPWSFTTQPATVRPAAEQKKRNQQALATLSKVLAEHYSHYDLRVKDWKRLEKDNTDAVLAAKSDRAFANAVATMLKPTEDIHLYLKFGDAMFATGTRAVDSLFRRARVEQHVKLAGAGPQALKGRTEDGIGYLYIAAWNGELDPDFIGGVITELADTKAMVIDVRANSGGDEGLAQRVAAWFVSGTKTYAKNRYRVRAGKDGFGPVLERQLAGKKEDAIYDKPIAVLTSRYVMSSNESFVMMMKLAKDCTVVGQPTFGSSGNPKPFELGNGVTAIVPTWQDLRPDGSQFEGEGLAPDVLVPCTANDLEKHDPILEKALEILRSKAAKKS
jgi:hypothetical protein